MSASPRRIGATRRGMSRASYWLSASVLTITSAPSFSAASRPAWKPDARPLVFVSRTMWSTPCARATSTVRSVEPSSMISHSTASKPGTSRGRSRSVSGSVASSSRHGIWMISFIAAAMEGTAARGNGRKVRSVALALLCLAVATGFVVYPTYPVYDSYYALLWGREILDGLLPRFEGFRFPTEHPLAVAVGALLGLLGDDADRVWVALVLAAFVCLVWGLFRLA